MASLKSRFFHHIVHRRLASFRALKLPLHEARAAAVQGAFVRHQFELADAAAAAAAAVQNDVS